MRGGEEVVLEHQARAVQFCCSIGNELEVLFALVLLGATVGPHDNALDINAHVLSHICENELKGMSMEIGVMLALV